VALAALQPSRSSVAWSLRRAASAQSAKGRPQPFACARGPNCGQPAGLGPVRERQRPQVGHSGVAVASISGHGSYLPILRTFQAPGRLSLRTAPLVAGHPQRPPHSSRCDDKQQRRKRPGEVPQHDQHRAKYGHLGQFPPHSSGIGGPGAGLRGLALVEQGTALRRPARPGGGRKFGGFLHTRAQSSFLAQR